MRQNFARPATPLAPAPKKRNLGMRIYRTIQLLVVGSLTAAMILGWRALNDPSQFPINVVKVKASYQHIDKNSLEELITPQLNHSFFNLNTDRMEQDLQHIPWVATAHIRRIWPDGIDITLIEQTPIGQWGKSGLINASGQIFSVPANTMPAQLPVFNAPDDQAIQLLDYFTQMSALLAPLKLKIAELDSNERHAYSLTLTDGTKIWLGRTDPLPHLQRFVKVYPKMFTTSDKKAESIDLRYDNGISVKWQATQPEETHGNLQHQ